MKRCLKPLAFVVLSFFAGRGFAAAPTHHEKMSDAEIEGAIRSKLAKSKIGKDGFTVHVHNGVATWQGATRIMQHKGAATRMAKTAGATQVVNNIKVTDDARAAAAGNLASQPKHATVKQE